MDLLIRNGRVYTQGRLQPFDIWIRDGRIAALGGAHHADETLDARGLMVLPGAIDIHVHFRDPGANYKEDWMSGSTSAAAGGVTTVVDQPNTDPRTLDNSSYQLKLELASRRSVVDFGLNGGPGKIFELLKAGALAIGEIFTYEMDEERLRAVLQKVKEAGALPTVHAEDGAMISQFTADTVEDTDADAYSRARPAPVEVTAVRTVLSAANNVHFCHLSTAEGLQLIREARGEGRAVTCEVAPHHLFFDRRDYRRWGSFLKMNPPLRDGLDSRALWEGLRNGDVQVLASDHAPHLPEEKKGDIWEAPPGVPGVETMLPLMLGAVRGNMLTLDRLVEALCTWPARLLGLGTKGSIDVGRDADLVLINTREQRVIRADKLHSRADWTPYEGRKGIFPQMTLVRGQVVYDGELVVRPGYGKNLPGAGLQRMTLADVDRVSQNS